MVSLSYIMGHRTACSHAGVVDFSVSQSLSLLTYTVGIIKLPTQRFAVKIKEIAYVNTAASGKHSLNVYPTTSRAVWVFLLSVLFNHNLPESM